MAQKNNTGTMNNEQLLSLAPQLLELLKGVQQVELQNVTLEIGDLEFFIPTSAFSPLLNPPLPTPVLLNKPTELIRESYVPLTTDYPGTIREVTLGATKSQGGSRSKTITCLLYTSDAADE